MNYKQVVFHESCTHRKVLTNGCMFPLFFGSTSNLEEYPCLEGRNWRHFFYHHHYSKKGNVKFIVSTIKEYALTWRNRFYSKRRRSKNHEIPSWKEIKLLMRKRLDRKLRKWSFTRIRKLPWINFTNVNMLVDRKEIQPCEDFRKNCAYCHQDK